MATKKREQRPEGENRSKAGVDAAITRLTALAAAHGSALAPDNLFPYLNPPGFGEEAGTASQRLVAGWAESPLVTLGHDAGVAVLFSERSELNEESLRLGLRNLRARAERAPWETNRAPSPHGPIDLFVRAGDDLTASDLADPEFLQAAYRKCGGEVAFFAIPTRDMMLMASHPDPVARIAGMAFTDEENAHPISPCVFAFKGSGELLPMIPKAG